MYVGANKTGVGIDFPYKTPVYVGTLSSADLDVDTLDVQHREERVLWIDSPCRHGLQGAWTERRMEPSCRSVEYAAIIMRHANVFILKYFILSRQ